MRGNQLHPRVSKINVLSVGSSPTFKTLKIISQPPHGCQFPRGGDFGDLALLQLTYGIRARMSGIISAAIVENPKHFLPR